MAITITGQCVNPDQSVITTGVTVIALFGGVNIAQDLSDGVGRFSLDVNNGAAPGTNNGNVQVTFCRQILINTACPQQTLANVQTNENQNLKKVIIPA